jgi:hypothetical protein
MKENLIEADGVIYAWNRGWTVYKWAAPGQHGILDRLFFKKSIAFAIEFKSTGKKATPKQRAEALKLKRAGIPCRCCDNVQDARAFIDAMTEAVNSGDLVFKIRWLATDIASFDP